MSFVPVQYPLSFMNEDYSNRELDERFTALQDSFEVRLDVQTQTLARIESQTTKTNGHVADAFKQIATLQGENRFIRGGAAASAFFLVMLTAAVGWVTVDYLNHRDKVPSEEIQAAVNQAFQNNYKK